VSKWTKFGVAVLAIGTIAGCGSDSGSTSTLSQADKTALTQALTNTEFGGLAAYVVQVVGKIGKMDAATVNDAITTAFDKALSLSTVGVQGNAYEGAVGIAIEYDELGQTGWFYGVIGWNGINTSTNTVDEIVLVGGLGESGTLPSSASGTVESGNVLAFYETPGHSYFGLTGTATVNSSSFSGSTNCGASSQGYTVVCTYSTGTMDGNFLFTAQSDDATPLDYTQPEVTFSSLPAVKITLQVTQG
jgi:hypothetical protein